MKIVTIFSDGTVDIETAPGFIMEVIEIEGYYRSFFGTFICFELVEYEDL